MSTERLHYRIDGSGTPIVLLHPVGLDLTFFDALVAELCPRFQILRPDMRGHGDSPRIKADASWQLEDFADDVHLLLQHLHYGPATIIGFSFGGMVAQVLALNHPGDLSALVISACVSTFSDEVRKVLLERGFAVERHGMASIVDTTLERWFTAAFREQGKDMPTRQRLLKDDIQSWKQTWSAIAGLNTIARLSSIAVPTLCLAAEKDLSVPPENLKTIAKAIPGAQFEIMPGLPHMLFIEDPKAVAEVIARFLNPS